MLPITSGSGTVTSSCHCLGSGDCDCVVSVEIVKLLEMALEDLPTMEERLPSKSIHPENSSSTDFGPQRVPK
jgi:hypothetical protein